MSQAIDREWEELATFGLRCGFLRRWLLGSFPNWLLLLFLFRRL